MTVTHKPARVDNLRSLAKCSCGWKYKGYEYNAELAKHLDETSHVGGVRVEYSESDVFNSEMAQNELDDALSVFSSVDELESCNAGPEHEDDDATGYKTEQYTRPASGDTLEQIAAKRKELLIALNGTPRAKLQLIGSQFRDSAESILKSKNEDYAKESDPFANFRMFGGLGILVRLSDKLARLRQYEDRREFSVSDENLRDTCIDLSNYAMLYYAWSKMEGGK